MAYPFGEALGFVGLEGVAFAHHDDLLGREHRHRFACREDGIRYGRNVRIGREEDLPRHRIVLEVAKRFFEESLDALFL